MFTDAHCHPADLLEKFPQAEEERRGLGCVCAASAWNLEQFELHEGLARKAAEEKGPALLRCFAVHPQLPAMGGFRADEIRGTELPLLEKLAREGRLDAVGETGFDLYNRAFRETEGFQGELFEAHLETAIKYALPLVLHVRRAMHRIFAYSAALKKVPAVIFHSWPGTLDEGSALLRRGINAWFSFGNPIMLNHRESMRCCALFPAERLLLETDAPYQPRREGDFSSWADLPLIAAAMGHLRGEAGSPGQNAGELEALIEANFFRAFMVR